MTAEMRATVRALCFVLLITFAVAQQDTSSAELLEKRLNDKHASEKNALLANGGGDEFTKWTPPTMPDTPDIAKDPEAPDGPYQSSEYEKTRQYYEEQNQELRVKPAKAAVTKSAVEHENPAVKGKEGAAAKTPKYARNMHGELIKGEDGMPVVEEGDGTHISMTLYAKKYGDLTGAQLDAPALGGDGTDSDKEGVSEGPDTKSDADAQDVISNDEKDNLFDLETNIKEMLDKLKEDLKEEQTSREEERADFTKRFEETFNTGKAAQEQISRRLSTLRDRSQVEATKLLEMIETHQPQGLTFKIGNEDTLCSALEDRFKTVIGDNKILKFWSGRTTNMCLKDANGGQRDDACMEQNLGEGASVGECETGIMAGTLDFGKQCPWEVTFYIIPSTSEERSVEDTVEIELNGIKYGPYTNSEKAEVSLKLSNTDRLKYQFKISSSNTDVKKHMAISSGKAQCMDNETKGMLMAANAKIKEAFDMVDKDTRDKKAQFAKVVAGEVKMNTDKFTANHVNTLKQKIAQAERLSEAVNKLEKIPTAQSIADSAQLAYQAMAGDIPQYGHGASGDVGADDNMFGNLLSGAFPTTQTGGSQNQQQNQQQAQPSSSNSGGPSAGGNTGAQYGNQAMTTQQSPMTAGGAIVTPAQADDMKAWMSQTENDNRAFIKLIMDNRAAGRTDILSRLNRNLDDLEMKEAKMASTYQQFMRTLPRLMLDMDRFNADRNGANSKKLNDAYQHLNSIGAKF